ncbi:LuxR family transcriptional regulator [Rathayibacter sp. SD072]|uniref:helix-turn-helix transcriptional regulator n=1 Tax=Rathayibacter sp. SD072 TaxID=2781731 RepID=UPI001A9742BB|nr:LuxR family transcriptional regulator [Rathayibacter sp. SD072]MBO0985141.1 hypothetical protein [Rathayibacter sp. SD072]
MITADALDRLAAALDEQHWSAVVELLDRHWSRSVHEYAPVLLAALDRVPDSVLDERPRWIRARDFLRSRSPEARPAGAQEQPAGLLQTTARIAELRRANRAREALPALQDARELLGSIPCGSSAVVDAVRAELHYQWGCALEEAGATEDALDEYEAAVRSAPLSGSAPRMLSLAGGAAALLAALRGERARAVRALADAATGSGAADPLAGAVSATLAEGFLRFDELDRAEARRLIARIDRAAIGHRWAPYFHLRAAVEWERQGTRRLAVEFETHLAALPPGAATDAQTEHLRIIRYLLFAADGRREQARDALGPDSPTRTLLEQFTTALRAHDLVQRGRRAEARVLLAPLRGRTTAPRAEVLALVAAPERSCGDLERIAELLAEHRLLWLLPELPSEDRHEVARLLGGRGVVVPRAIEPAEERALSLLTAREREVAEHAALGDSVIGIAAALHVSANTVKSQLRSVYRKLGVSSRHELLAVLQSVGRDGADRAERSS